MNRKLDCKGWRLVITGHSLGAGAAALIALKLYGRFQGMVTFRCTTGVKYSPCKVLFKSKL